MSRYTVTPNRYEFAFGWDPPLRYFFLDVYDTEGDCEEPVYNNLSRQNPAMTITEIREVCRSYGWELPDRYELKLLSDRLQNR